jgi:hypothetical protein
MARGRQTEGIFSIGSFTTPSSFGIPFVTKIAPMLSQATPGSNKPTKIHLQYVTSMMELQYT